MVWHYPAKRNCNPGSTNDEMRAGELGGRRSERSKINKLTWGYRISRYWDAFGL